MTDSPAMSPSAMPVDDLLATLPDRRRAEAHDLIAMMREIAGDEPVVWAAKIIGFGRYHYRYESGHSGTAPLVGFAPTPRHQAIYLAAGYQERYPKLVAQLALDPDARAPRFGVGCLYLTSLDAIDRAVLRSLIERSMRVHRGMDQGESPTVG